MSKTVSKFKLAAGVSLALAFTILTSCASNPLVKGGVGGGGSSNCSANFRTKKIGTQTWATENLNCNVSGSKCYGNDPAYCAKYGRLYNWATAKAVCPKGWHLPSDAEWTTLTNYVGKNAGAKLKSSTGWYTYSGALPYTDDYGFSALPGGLGFSDGDFRLAGYEGLWWSATEYGASSALYRAMGQHHGGGFVDRYDFNKSFHLLSVRCVKD